MLYKILKFVITSLSKLFIKEINGLESISKKDGFIIASNHTSYLDPPFITSVIASKFNRKVHNLGKKELFNSFIGKAFHNAVETIPIDRTGNYEEPLSKAIEYLKKGKIIGIFPEGGRSRTGKLQKGKTGVARLTLIAKVPVVPVGIIGSYEVWPYNKKFLRIKKNVKINFGKPINFSKYYNKKINKKILRQIADEIMKNIAKLSDQKYSY